jgi:hypothetical protein
MLRGCENAKIVAEGLSPEEPITRIGGLVMWWAPIQIKGSISFETPDDPEMRYYGFSTFD